MRQTILASLVLAAALAGCGGDSGSGGGGGADMTVLANGCPPLLTPQTGMTGDTWDPYAKGFFAQYCTRCHATTLVGAAARSGAPDGLNWDDEAAVKKNAAAIRQAVGEQNFMPPSAPVPSCAERQRITGWIDAKTP